MGRKSLRIVGCEHHVETTVCERKGHVDVGLEREGETLRSSRVLLSSKQTLTHIFPVIAM